MAYVQELKKGQRIKLPGDKRTYKVLQAVEVPRGRAIIGPEGGGAAIALNGNEQVEIIGKGFSQDSDPRRVRLHRALDAVLDRKAGKDADTVQIVIAWVEDAQELDKERSKSTRRDMGESYKFKDIRKPFAVMWLNKGTEADVAKARAYASSEGRKVFVYKGVGDPLARAKADVLKAAK